MHIFAHKLNNNNNMWWHTNTHTYTPLSPSCCYRLLCVPLCGWGYICAYKSSVPSFTLSPANENNHPLKKACQKQASWCYCLQMKYNYGKLRILRDGVYHIKQKKQEAPFYLINSFSTTECRVTTEMFCPFMLRAYKVKTFFCRN